MRKASIFIPILSVLLGAAGYYARYTQLQTVFAGNSNLPAEGTTISLIIMAGSAAVIAAAALIGILIASHHISRRDYCRAFTPSSVLHLGLKTVFSAALVGVGGHIVYKTVTSDPTAWFDYVFPALSIFCGVSVFFLSLLAYRNKKNSAVKYISIIPVIFTCFWLVIVYKEHAADPIVINYVFSCLAGVFATLSFYYEAGYAYGKAATGRVIFSSMLTVVFGAIVLCDDIPLIYFVCVSAIMLIQLFNLSVFLRNLREKE